ENGKETFSVYAAKTQQFNAVAFSPDGRRLATCWNGTTTRVWDAVKGHELMTLTGHNGDVHGLAFSPDNRRLATCSVDRTVKVWDLQTGMEVCTLRAHTDAVHSVAFDHEGWRVISGAGDGTIKTWAISGASDGTIKTSDTIPDEDCITLPGHANL